MAPKRPSPLDEPPAASTSDEEEATSVEEEEEEEDSGSESGSEEEEDEPESEQKQPQPKTPAPMEETPTAKKPRSKSNTTATRLPASDPASEAKDSKRAKKKGPERDEEDEPGTAAEDETKRLEMILRRSYPSADMNAFHDFIKKSLHVNVTKSQLVDKIRRLKKKYANNAGKKKFNPTKPHEQKAFDLSKKIWGNEQPSGEHVLKRGLDMIVESKRVELEEKWKKLNLAELELYARRSQLISDQAKLILDAYKSSDH
ncbi:hypothetical protein FNV43_RR06554 [Rhamnella rubrinervis]|uniref:Glabrous enhancer-binding protein-like DBD domain-containing protein n=1 Tax=Rhamnella rubrinervis TaxID=2594499 RepID=A0A8K0MLE2_9ROSA|nr:hypothetical protein FNV43_RR06554 [Rhamnella rubrinervis]